MTFSKNHKWIMEFYFSVTSGISERRVLNFLAAPDISSIDNLLPLGTTDLVLPSIASPNTERPNSNPAFFSLHRRRSLLASSYDIEATREAIEPSSPVSLIISP